MANKPQYTVNSINWVYRNKFTDAQWRKIKVRNVTPIRNGNVVIPEDTYLEIHAKSPGGFTVTAPACSCCGISPVVTQVDPQCLTIPSESELEEAAALSAPAPLATGGAGEATDGMSESELKYFKRLASLSPTELLADWQATEETSHVEPESYKPEYVKLLLLALEKAASPAPGVAVAAGGGWVACADRLPERLLQDDGNTCWYSECVLLHLGFHRLPVVGYYDYRKGYTCFQCYDRDEEFPIPTHWQPLPESPAAN